MVAETQAEYQSDAGSTNDTPYLALMGEIWVVFCEYCWENFPCYNGTALYHVPWTHIPEYPASIRGNIALHANLILRYLTAMFRCWGKMFFDEIDIYYEKTLRLWSISLQWPLDKGSFIRMGYLFLILVTSHESGKNYNTADTWLGTNFMHILADFFSFLILSWFKWWIGPLPVGVDINIFLKENKSSWPVMNQTLCISNGNNIFHSDKYDKFLTKYI